MELSYRDFKRKMEEETLKYQKKYGFKLGIPGHETWNSEADAFKHAYMQWTLNKDYSKPLGNIVSTHHEAGPKNPPNERNMDLWNNAIGNEIFDDIKQKGYLRRDYDGLADVNDIAAQKIVEKLRNGEMISDPNDPRQFKNMELERLKDTDRVFYKGELKRNDGQAVEPNLAKQYMNQAVDNNWQIPEKDVLDKKVKSGELLYVNDFVKTDGSRLNGYYKKRRKSFF